MITDPPPAAALIREDDQAHWYGSSGSCTLAFTDHEVDTPYLDPNTGAQLEIRKESYKYWVKTDPGASFTLSCTTTADATRGTEDLNGIADQCGEAGVSWGVQCWAIDVVLAGTTIDLADQNKPKILPGQKLSASLDIQGAPLTVSSYSWAISGCGPFKNYDPTITPPTFAAYSGDTTATTFGYLSSPGSTMVSCTFTAVITGSNPSENVTGTASRATSVSDIGVTLFEVEEHVFNGNSAYKVGFDQGMAIIQYVGMQFRSKVLTPLPFYNPATAGADPGKWAFCQKVVKTVRQYRSRQTGLIVDVLNEDPSNRLDKAFPYPVGSSPAPPVPADNTEGTARDWPAEGDPFDTVNKVIAHDQFEMYLLYCPPGQDSKYVAPRMRTWKWGGSFGFVSTNADGSELWTSTWDSPCGAFGATQTWIPQPRWTGVFN